MHSAKKPMLCLSYLQVFDTPGGHVTRDYREGLGQLADLSFRLLDTSGLEPTAHPTSLQVGLGCVDGVLPT